MFSTLPQNHRTMTEEEIRKTLAIITVAWPDKPLFTDAESMLEVANLWAAMFSDVADGQLMKAASALVATAKFRPSIAELRKEALRGRLLDLTSGEAWSEVIAAIGRYGARRTPEWSSPVVKLAVQSIGGWSALCRSLNMTADRARFLDYYTNIVDGAKHEVLAGRGKSVDDVCQARLPEERREKRDRLGGGVSIAALLPKDDS